MNEKRLLVTIKSPNVILRIKVGDSSCDKNYSTNDKFLINPENETSSIRRLKELGQLTYRTALPSDTRFHLVTLSEA